MNFVAYVLAYKVYQLKLIFRVVALLRSVTLLAVHFYYEKPQKIKVFCQLLNSIFCLYCYLSRYKLSPSFSCITFPKVSKFLLSIFTLFFRVVLPLSTRVIKFKKRNKRKQRKFIPHWKPKRRKNRNNTSLLFS